MSSANSRSTTGAWWHGMFLVLKKLFLIKKQNKKYLLFHDAKSSFSHHVFPL